VLAADGSATAQLSSLNGGALSGARNRIINGDMRIDQRNAGASVTPTSSGYTLDRWQAVLSQASKYSVQQNAGAVTPPTGYNNYLGVTSLSAYSVGAGDFFCLTHYIEGFNSADFGFGTAGASTVTLSFWVRSSLTGTFGGSLQNNAQNRCYPFSYTISAANTWEKKTVTIAGDTTGTWLADNGRGIGLVLGLGVGSTFGSGTAGAWIGSQVFVPTGSISVVGTNGATFYITGVQLEPGSVATPFERRSFGQELALASRYYYRVNATSSYTPYGHGWNVTSSSGQVVVRHPVRMRVAPTSLDYSLLSSGVLGASEALVATAGLNSATNGTDASTVDISSSSLFTTGFVTLTAKASTSSYIGFGAEL
jgi:hypothetical protein